MPCHKLVAFAAGAALCLALSLNAAADTRQPPPSVPKGQEHEENNFHGRVPLVADSDPVFAGNLEGIKAMANALRRGLGTKPLVRAYERLYARLYPFDHPFTPKPAVPVAAARKPEAVPSWTFLGPTNIPGRITALVRHPSDPNILYAGGADGGVWKTTDAGSTWTALTDFAQTLSIGSIAMNPQNPSELWVGTGEGNFAIDNYPGGHILHTTDGGATWTTLTTAMGDVRGLAIKPDNPATLFAAAGARASGSVTGGIFKSTDSGQTWAQLSNGIPTGMMGTEVLVDPSATSTVYAALGYIYGSGNNGIYKSTDSGATFSKLAGGFPTANVGRVSLAMAPSQTSTLYAAVQSSSTFGLLGVFKSTDGGATWSQLSLGGTASNFCSEQCWYDLEVAVDPANPDKVYLGGVDIYRSTDGGQTFSQVSVWYLNMSDSRYVHADQHALVPTGPGELWAGCDGGVSYSSSSGDSWSFRGKGLNTTQYYNLAMHPTKANWSLGGTQDNGTHLFSGTDKFSEVYGGDGGYCAISPADPNTMYEEYVYLDLHKSTNGGSNWISASSGISSADPVLFIAPFVMDPSNPSTLYAGTNRVYRTSNAASSWIPMSTNGWAGNVSAIGVGPATGGVVIAGTQRGEVYLCTNPADGSPNWNYAASGLPNRYVTSFAVAPDEQTLYVTLSGTGTAHIFKSADRGGSWTALSAGLPDEPFNSIVIHPAQPNSLYAGSDFGVYASFDAGATWSPYGTDLPRAAVDSLQVSGPLGILQAATHGRGVWQAPALTSGLLSVQPSAVPSSGPAPLAVTFTASAAGGSGPYTFAWDFGDAGTTGSGSPATHTYASLGSYTATVTVTDSVGARATGTARVSVIVPPPAISSVAALSNPFRLKVAGSGFQTGCTVKIDGTAAPTTVFKSATSALAKGSGLKTMVPRGTQVVVTVVNTDGSASGGFPFTR